MTSREPDRGPVPRVVHCHFPVRVRVRGIPDDELLSALRAAVRRQLRAQLDAAERELARLALGRRGDGRDARPTGYGRQSDAVVPAEPYDPDRDGPDGYALPSYDDRGQRVAVPVRRSGPGWRVVRSATLRMTVGSFLDYVEQVLRGYAPGEDLPSLLPGRVLLTDIENDRRPVTAWLVQTTVAMSLTGLMDELQRHATQLHRTPADQHFATAASPFDADKQLIAMLEPSGQLGGWPELRRHNHDLVTGSGATMVLRAGARIVWTGMALPQITPSSLLDIGPVEQLTLPLADTAYFVDAAAFERRNRLSWQQYVADAGSRSVRLDLMPFRLRVDAAGDAAAFLMRWAYDDTATPAPADTAPAVQLTWVDDGSIRPPAVVVTAGRQFVAALPALPAPPRPGPTGRASGDDRLPPGAALVYAVVHLPVDADTLAAAQLRPVARRLAATLRGLLADDPSANRWKYRFYGWLGDAFGQSPPADRPPGGTAFEYVLAELEASADLERFFDAAEGTGWDAVSMRVLLLCMPTRFRTHPRVVRLRAEKRQQALAGRRNVYRDTVDATNRGSVDIERDPDDRVSIGVPGRDVLGDLSSLYIFERSVTTIKPAAATRLREALQAVRLELIADVGAGRVSVTLTPEEFLRESVGRAAQRAKVSDDDFEEQKLQRSLRLTAVHQRDINELPSWDVTFEVVERVRGTREWIATSRPLTETADEFEARLIYWRLGKAGEAYQTIGMVIVVVGLVAVAWEAGIIAALISAAGGGTAVLVSIAISELIYIVRVVFFDAELSFGGFAMAAVEGYLGALGFRAGALAAGPLARSIGTASMRRLWGGIVLEKLVAGSVGGGATAVLETFAHDVVDVVFAGGSFSSAATYVHKLGIGAALGVLGEFTLSPVLHRLAARGGTALTAAADLVQQLRRDGFDIAQFTTAAAEALAGVRRSAALLAAEGATNGYVAAFRDRIEEMLTAWGSSVAARRVLELAGAEFSGAALAGVRRFLATAEAAGSPEAARRLAGTFAAHPQQAVHLMEVLATLDDAAARRLMNGTFSSRGDLATFLGRLDRYGPQEQRAILSLLSEADLVTRAGAAPVEQAINRRFGLALRAQAQAAREEAARLRQQAQQLVDEAALVNAGRPAQVDELLARARAVESGAVERDAFSEVVAPGIGAAAPAGGSPPTPPVHPTGAPATTGAAPPPLSEAPVAPGTPETPVGTPAATTPAPHRLPDDFVDEAIGALDTVDNPFDLHIGDARRQAIQAGERDFALDRPVGFDVDEPLPVGARDIRVQRAYDRALDPHNRQLLDSATNRSSKYLGLSEDAVARHRTHLPPVSVVSEPSAVFTRRFDEVTELQQVFDDAVARVGNARSLSPTELKNRINGNARRIIGEGLSPAGVRVRDALRSLGFEYVPNRGLVAVRPQPSP